MADNQPVPRIDPPCHVAAGPVDESHAAEGNAPLAVALPALAHKSRISCLEDPLGHLLLSPCRFLSWSRVEEESVDLALWPEGRELVPGFVLDFHFWLCVVVGFIEFVVPPGVALSVFQTRPFTSASRIVFVEGHGAPYARDVGWAGGISHHNATEIVAAQHE